MLLNMCLPMSHPIAFQCTILLARNSKISIESSFLIEKGLKHMLAGMDNKRKANVFLLSVILTF